MTRLLQDLRYTLRTLRKSPGFAIAAILSLAIGIGANATIFSIASAVLMRHLPVKDASSLVSVYWAGKQAEGEVSYPDYKDIAEDKSVFQSTAAFCPLIAFSMGGSGEPERVWGQVVTGNFFETLGVQPIHGRGFLPEEDQVPGRNPVVVLGYGLWNRMFASNPNVVGRDVVINKTTFRVVGVAPEGFRGTFLGVMPEMWIPTMMQAVAMPSGDSLHQRGDHWLDVIARLKPGVSREQAQIAMAAFAKRHPDTYGKAPDDTTLHLTGIADLHPTMKNGVATFVAVLLVVVGLVLTIACANVANLLLARATARSREIAIRLAIGAGRSTLVRQLLTESTLLAIAGGLGGILIASWAAGALNGFHLPMPVPIDFRVSVDTRVLAVTFLLSLVTGLVFGLSPALHATRADVQNALKDEVVSTRWRRFGMRNVLVVAQVAIALVLLIGTGLFLRSLGNARGIDIGFNPRPLLLFSVDTTTAGYSDEQSKAFLKQLTARLESTPGVTSATTTALVPLSIGGNSTIVDDTQGKQSFITDIYHVSPQYFETLGLPLLRGRDFRYEGPQAPRYAVINETFAERMWPGQDPIGKTFAQAGTQKFEVVGLVKNSKSRMLGEGPKPIFYESVDQTFSKGAAQFGTSVIVKATGDPAALTGTVREVVHQLDPHMAIFNVETMDHHLTNALFLPRLAATLFGVFGSAGLLLASIGLYGLISYSVSRRTQEIGVRMALGAARGDVRAMVMRQGMALAIVGVVIGVALSAAVTRVASSLLFGISPLDSVTFVAVPAVLLAVALLATIVPAFRATRVDPMIALRYQ